VTRQSYATEIRIIRIMCTGRVDMAFVLRAFQKGADGVIIGVCWPGECHYVTEGNYDALGNMLLLKKLMAHVGMATDRLRLEWISAAEGTRFAEVMSDFTRQLKELGPLGEGDGLQPAELAFRLESLSRLVPFAKLVEREKLRVPERTEEAIRGFYASEQVERLFHEVIAKRLAQIQILMLLEQEPLSTRDISERLGLTPSVVSRHMNDSSRQSLVRYDVERNCFALAGQAGD
jgi:coenzyme F420-reducing hydrogenase delta subunit/DNA-binding CsgD family transcriptional regulator